MGPNGSGKSTLAQVLAGRETYEVTAGSVTYDGKDLLALKPEERAAAGIFLAFQYPVEIPGVTNPYFLRAALNSIRKQRGLPEVDAFDFTGLVKEKMALLDMTDEGLMKRAVNVGFSGGEKKRNEILQLAAAGAPALHPGRDRFGAGHRRAQGRRQGSQLAAQPRAVLPGGHPLPAPLELHRARLCTRDGERPDRENRRQEPGPGAGAKGLRGSWTSWP